ncbi:hypothetical protein K443DRAFT_685363 [Laccaria amethystina LaAM-08-1]|uniref:Uncharacterized protein n=1 Tax=Laccaria amethystina LaAM-08-1 TaxID=1095629 RepID=A0A0C9WNU5_9AGAR|nr:hypothetical protein K443DRAFT_685363 [Laccaria amethystina LaAM-08-1]
MGSEFLCKAVKPNRGQISGSRCSSAPPDLQPIKPLTPNTSTPARRHLQPPPRSFSKPYPYRLSKFSPRTAIFSALESPSTRSHKAYPNPGGVWLVRVGRFSQVNGFLWALTPLIKSGFLRHWLSLRMAEAAHKR